MFIFGILLLKKINYRHINLRKYKCEYNYRLAIIMDTESEPVHESVISISVVIATYAHTKINPIKLLMQTHKGIDL